MARPQQVSDAEIRQACMDTQAAGKPLSIRTIYAVTGGDTKRIGRILDEFRAQQNIDPLAATAPAGPVKPEDLPEAVKKSALASAVPGYQAAVNVAETKTAQYREETRQARDDRDFALNLHALALKDLDAAEDALAQEKQARLLDQQNHAAALRQVLDNSAQQLADARKDYTDQLAIIQKQVAGLNETVKTLTREKAEAESARKDADQKLTDALGKLQAAQIQIGELIVGKAQAEGAKTILESREKAAQVVNEQLTTTLQMINEQLARQTTLMGQFAEKADRVEELAEQVGVLQEMISPPKQNNDQQVGSKGTSGVSRSQVQSSG